MSIISLKISGKIREFCPEMIVATLSTHLTKDLAFLKKLSNVFGSCIVYFS